MNETSKKKTECWQKPGMANVYIERVNEKKGVTDFFYNTYFHEVCSRYINSGWKVLDIGCGPGLTSCFLADMGCSVVSSDVSKLMLEQVEKDKGDRDIEIRHGDVFDIPAQDNEFDAVTARMLMPHFPDWDKVLCQVSRVLRKGGYFVYDFSNAEHLSMAREFGTLDIDTYNISDDPNEVNKFLATVSREDLEKVACSCGFEVVDVIPVGLFYDNALFCSSLSKDDYAETRQTIMDNLQNEEVWKFLYWMEQRIICNLPPHFTRTNFTILEKVENI